jgi:hypothetical protein
MKLVKNNRFAFVTSMLLALTGLVTLVAMLPAPGVSATTAYKDRVLVTTTTTGTGTLTQVATFTGYRAPAASDDGKTFTISIVAVDSSGNPTGDWEITDSVYTHSGTTWSRGTLHSSSTGSRVSFAVGTKRIAIVNSASDIAKIGNFVDVANAASSGSGTQADPWIIDSFTPTAYTRVNARSGYYSYSTSPAWAVNGLHLYCEAGAYFQHTGTGYAFNLVNADAANTFVNGVRIENLNVLGRYATGTGTITTTNGSVNVVGVGTAFTTQLAVGNAISVNAGGTTVESHKIATITDNTHLTVEESWVGANAGVGFTYGTSSDGFRLEGLEYFYLDNCSCRDQSSYALNILGSSFGEVHAFQYSIDNPTYHSYYHVKGDGIHCGTLGGQAVTTEVQFFSPECDNFRNYGIYIEAGHSNQVFGGSFESSTSPAKAVRIDGDGHYFYGTDCEGITTGYDFYVTGYCNGLINCTGSCGLGSVFTGGACIQNTTLGGQFKTIALGGNLNRWENVACTLAGGSGFTGSGSRVYRIGCQDQNGAVANLYDAHR